MYEPAVALDPPLGDILQNITKVNTLLQDLIKNYEKLKKMSDPGSIDGTYEDTEIHELLDDSHEKKKKKNSKPTTSAAVTIRIQGTAMEVSNEKTYNTASTKPKRRERKRHNKKNNLRSENGNSQKGLPARLKEIAEKIFSNHLNKTQETTKKSHPSTTTKSTDQTIEDCNFHGTTTTEAKKEKTKDLEPRFRHRTGLVHKKNRQKERHPIYIQKQEPVIQLADINDTTIEESKVILNAEIKTKVLREAYGDACLKLVVRKCYMACKSVFKEVCRTNHKCSPEFKQNFKKHAITGCDSSFYNNSVETRAKHIKKHDHYVELPDITREGYLSMACGPISSSQMLRSGLNVTSTEIKSLRPILRADKYELACQQASRMKCYKACKHAAAEACKEEKCAEKKKTALDKACKNHCKQSYGGKDSDDDSDSEESGSESGENNEPVDEWR